MTQRVAACCVSAFGLELDIVRPSPEFNDSSNNFNDDITKLTATGFSLHGDSAPEIIDTLAVCATMQRD